MNEKISILVAANDEYKEGVLSLTLSLAFSQKEAVDIYLLTGDFTDIKENYHAFSEESVSYIKGVCDPYKQDISFFIIDCRPLFDQHFKDGKNNKTSFTPYSALRLLMDKIPSLPDRLLYLDGDIIVMKDLKEFFQMDMGNKEIGMALDVVGHHWLGRRYCNSGVMLCDLAALRKNCTFDKTRNFINKHRLFMPDQSALNFTLKDKKLVLPYIYNEQRTTTEETVIRHYCRMPKCLHFVKVRPWQCEKFRKHYPGEATKIVDILESEKRKR